MRVFFKLCITLGLLAAFIINSPGLFAAVIVVGSLYILVTRVGGASSPARVSREELRGIDDRRR